MLLIIFGQLKIFFNIQDSLHISQIAAQERAAAAAAAAAKKKGIRSSLGRIFGRKEKGLKGRPGGFVTAPMNAGGVHSVYLADSEMVQSDSMGGLGGLAGKGDFDRRKKKKYV